jgi:uncharacterized protein (DUF362 family)
MSPPLVHVLRTGPDVGRLAGWVAPRLPDIAPRSILVKPNWVRHETSPVFPIAALVTSAELIEAVVRACLARYPRSERITVGDVPLQDCDWDALRRQARLGALEVRLASAAGGAAIAFRDLRRERFRLDGGFLRGVGNPQGGDPLGYREVRVGQESLLDPITGPGPRLAVSDYDSRLIAESHRPGEHRYLVAGSALDADLIVNLPKMKTHQKAGMTGALKNLVGITGQKGSLVHYRVGTPRRGGDEFAPDASRLIRLQSFMRGRLQKRSPVLFAVARGVWKVLRRVAGIRTEGTAENLDAPFYMAGGAWYGNDTIWRMIYDLNRIVRYADRDGVIRDRPQRAYAAILDGMVAGEGNGPLQPLPVETGIVAMGDDPFALDTVASRLMGFDRLRIPQLAHAAEFGDPLWGTFDTNRMTVDWDGRTVTGLDAVPVLHRFRPPPGWKGHIELP